MNKVLTSLFWFLIVAGIIIRLLSLSFDGIGDMEVYHRWGLNTLKEGLNNSFQGIYYPFQYQVFELGAYLTIKLKTDYFIVFKSINLLFDCGNLIVLYLIFRIIKVSKYYLLIYWLHPWFLIMFSQGYCDFQFTFFILCAVLFTFKATSRNYLIAGIFLGFAFLMKPQVQIVLLSIFIYSIYLFIKDKEIKTFHLFIFPAILFLDYSLYFFVGTHDPLRLVINYVDLGDKLPLNANFLNGWFPVAYYLKGPDEVIYSVFDNLMLLNFKLRTIAVLTLLVLIYFFIKKLIKNNLNNEVNHNLFLIVSFSTFIFPFIMTSAHENHLFLATVLLIPILGKTKSLLVKICIHIILLLQCINLYGFYGFGGNKFINKISITYNYEIAFVLSLIAFSAFLILTFYFISPKSGFLTQFKQPAGE